MQLGLTLNIPRPCGMSAIAQAISLLRNYGGSLWVASPQYAALNDDGSGVPAHGSAAGYLQDLVGSRHATQNLAARRPQLQLSNGKWGLKFDGVDDALLTAALATASAESFGVVYTAPAITGSAQFPISRRNTGTSLGSAIYLNGTSNSANFINGSNAAVLGAVVATGNVGVASVVGKVGSVAQRVNDVDGTPVPYAAYASTTYPFALGNSTDIARAFGGTIHAAYYAPVEISNADRLTLDRLLGKPFGAPIS